VEWRGLEIHPELPPEGIAREVYFGGRSRGAGESVQRLAAQAGLEMLLPAVIANSHAALEVAELARERGVFSSFHRRLFQAYFQEGLNIGESRVLAAVGEAVGLEPSEVLACLADHRYHDRMVQAQWEAQELLISGVPTFLIAGQRVVGAQPYAVLSVAVELAGARPRQP